jgi:mannose-6-phosphate isomerase-like protein (cupin superfamily)
MPESPQHDEHPLVVGAEDLLSAQAGASYREFLRVPALSLGLFAVGAEHRDTQTPHASDEVYVVVSGEAVLDVAGTRSSVRTGSVAYVPAGVPHHFEDTSDDLRVVVVFAPPEP